MERGFISRNNMGLFIRVNTVEKAIDEILQFYKVYHSIRYVGSKTVHKVSLINFKECLRNHPMHLLLGHTLRICVLCLGVKKLISIMI